MIRTPLASPTATSLPSVENASIAQAEISSCSLRPVTRQTTDRPSGVSPAAPVSGNGVCAATEDARPAATATAIATAVAMAPRAATEDGTGRRDPLANDDAK